MEKRFKALRIIGTVYKILGIIVGVLTILALLASCAMIFVGNALFGELNRELFRGVGGLDVTDLLAGLIPAILIIIYGCGLAVTLYALGEGVYLMLAIEENTRTSALLAARQENPPPAS